MTFEKTAHQKYNLALKKVVQRCEQRNKIYGCGFISDPIDYDIWNCYGKTKRALYILKNGNNHYEKLEDSLIDLCNYSLFALTKLEKSKKVTK